MIVKKLGTEKKWSQEQLAAMSSLSVRTIQRVARGESASIETLKSLASVFEIEIDKLTEVITMIDKKSETWNTQPYWFKSLFNGIRSKKIQLNLEFIFLISGLVTRFIGNKYITSAFIISSYVTGWSIRYGDSTNVW